MFRIPDPRTKYRNKKTELDGIIFGSHIEARRYSELKQLQALGEISDLSVHPVFRLLDKFRDPWSGDCQKSINYIGDFLYVEKGTHRVCEDVKGVQTTEFRIKWKWVKHLCPETEFRLVGKVRK